MRSNDLPNKSIDYVITGAMLPETNDPLSIYAMECEQYIAAREFIPASMHKHSYYELHYILEGQIDYSFPDGHTVSGSKGYWIIISTQTPHALYKIGAGSMKVTCQFGVGINEQLNGMLVSITKDIPCIIGKISNDMLDIIEKQKQFSKTNDPISSWIMRNNLLNLILKTLDSHLCDINKPHAPVTEVRKYDKIFYLALKFIKDNANHRISCADVAGVSYVSQKKLNEIFHQYIEKTVSECIAEYRVEYAKIELKSNKEKSIREISELLDFCNEYYFCRFFKKHTGKTPRQYRN